MKISIKQFFEMVTKTIAGPAATITDQDKRKAIRIFLYLDEFMMENVPEYCGDITGDTEFAEIDFGYYASGVLDEIDEELAIYVVPRVENLDGHYLLSS
jgi:hypothetical protein